MFQHGQTKLTGRNLGRVFHSRISRICKGRAIVHITKQPNLKLKNCPKHLYLLHCRLQSRKEMFLTLKTLVDVKKLFF